jgi:hypothetical protein
LLLGVPTDAKDPTEPLSALLFSRLVEAAEISSPNG